MRAITGMLFQACLTSCLRRPSPPRHEGDHQDVYSRTASAAPPGYLGKLAANAANGSLATVAIFGLFFQYSFNAPAWIVGRACREVRERPPCHRGNPGDVIPGQPHRLRLDSWADSPRTTTFAPPPSMGKCRAGTDGVGCAPHRAFPPLNSRRVRLGLPLALGARPHSFGTDTWTCAVSEDAENVFRSSLLSYPRHV